MVLNAALQTLREAEDLKQKILKFKNGVSMLQERNLWTLQQQLQKVYQKLLVLDLDYALDKKVEQDLWNIGFKQQIEALQAISKDRKNPRRSEGQAMLSWVLQAAAGFYLCLLHQICTAFKLDLPFRRRASMLGCVEGWGAGEGDARLPPPAAALYICQHCLVHLGDLARYRQQLRVAHTFYRHALLVSAHSGQPYNQLALVSWRRGRRLGALYWHVRSLLVRAPFPPAPANLARTLAAAAAQHGQDHPEDLPVLPGVTNTSAPAPVPVPGKVPTRLTAHSFVGELIRAYHIIHTVENLETAAQLVNNLNSSLTALVATNSFESMTLIKMACITIWLVHWATEELQLSGTNLAPGEAAAANLATSLAAGATVSLLLCSQAHDAIGLPALKVYLEWVRAHPRLLCDAAFASRPQIWPALARTLNSLAQHVCHFDGHLYESVPLPEDEELHGFLPLEQAFSSLKFANYASWDTYGDRIPEFSFRTDADNNGRSTPDRADDGSSPRLCEDSLQKEPELANKLRAWRLVQLGVALAHQLSETGLQYITTSTEDGLTTFTPQQSSLESAQLLRALEELSMVRDVTNSAADGDKLDEESEGESEDEARVPPPPVIISEADFRFKVREKRVGILKPQGSLERAREERAAQAATQDTAQKNGIEAVGSGKIAEMSEEAVEKSGEEARRGEGARRPRMNVAMAAIMRKAEETSKQVKFATPGSPTAPDTAPLTVEVSPNKDQEKPNKILQPKAIKSLTNLPVGKKTGGILSLKDKSAGYPHLVKTDPEPTKKPDEPKKIEGQKLSQPTQSSQQSFHPTPYSGKRIEHPQQNVPNWTNVQVPPPNHNLQYNENVRKNYQQPKYGINNMNLNPLYPQIQTNQGIRLPVVNPKEIDVRTAALQKQHSRPEFVPEGQKFGSQNWQPSGDKKAFLNDLPPRFANQFRNWQGNQMDPQFGGMPHDGNKFRDEAFQNNNMMFGTNNIQPNMQPNWMNNTMGTENITQPSYNWWKPENAPNFIPNYSNQSMNPAPSFYPQSMSNQSNPYQTPSYSQPPPNQSIPKPNDLLSNMGTSYMQTGLTPPQAQSLQNLMKPPNYNGFGNYSQQPYDSSMYPQFSNNKLGYQQPPIKMDKSYGEAKDQLLDVGHGLGLGGSVMNDLHPRSNLTMDLMAGVLTNDNMTLMKSLDQLGMAESNMDAGNTYSLFSSGQEPASWGASVPHTTQQQSLWSGPGPSPLERLLEQQKQLNKGTSEPQ